MEYEIIKILNPRHMLRLRIKLGKYMPPVTANLMIQMLTSAHQNEFQILEGKISKNFWPDFDETFEKNYLPSHFYSLEI